MGLYAGETRAVPFSTEAGQEPPTPTRGSGHASAAPVSLLADQVDDDDSGGGGGGGNGQCIKLLLPTQVVVVVVDLAHHLQIFSSPFFSRFPVVGEVSPHHFFDGKPRVVAGRVHAPDEAPAGLFLPLHCQAPGAAGGGGG